MNYCYRNLDKAIIGIRDVAPSNDYTLKVFESDIGAPLLDYQNYQPCIPLKKFNETLDAIINRTEQEINDEKVSLAGRIYLLLNEGNSIIHVYEPRLHRNLHANFFNCPYVTQLSEEFTVRGYNNECLYKYINNEIVARTDEEKNPEISISKKNQIRILRTPRLLTVDWKVQRAIDNSQVAMESNLRTYRQSLRDVPSSIDHNTDVENFSWPTDPDT